MKCPMKFNSPCCDISEECVGDQCAWFIEVHDTVEACAISWLAAAQIAQAPALCSKVVEEVGMVVSA